MDRKNFFRWLKYATALTLLFVLFGFILQVAVEGTTMAQAWALLLDVGLYQSALYAIIAATILTMKKD